MKVESGIFWNGVNDNGVNDRVMEKTAVKTLGYILRRVGDLAKFVLRCLWELFWFLLPSMKP